MCCHSKYIQFWVLKMQFWWSRNILSKDLVLPDKLYSPAIKPTYSWEGEDYWALKSLCSDYAWSQVWGCHMAEELPQFQTALGGWALSWGWFDCRTLLMQQTPTLASPLPGSARHYCDESLILAPFMVLISDQEDLNTKCWSPPPLPCSWLQKYIPLFASLLGLWIFLCMCEIIADLRSLP